MTKPMRATSHSATNPARAPSIAQVPAVLVSLWRRANDRLAAAQQAELLAELTDRQLLDSGLGDVLDERRQRVAVDGALMRRLMSLY